MRDNGIGMQEMDDDPDSSLGLHLVHILAKDQLQGKIKMTGKNGTAVKITFKTVKS